METSLEVIAKVRDAEVQQELLLAAAEVESAPAPYALSDLGQRAWRMGMVDAAKMLRERAAEL
jgi:hypothetical protein